jgi:hypothetical protein
MMTKEDTLLNILVMQMMQIRRIDFIIDDDGVLVWKEGIQHGVR